MHVLQEINEHSKARLLWGCFSHGCYQLLERILQQPNHLWGFILSEKYTAQEGGKPPQLLAKLHRL